MSRDSGANRVSADVAGGTAAPWSVASVLGQGPRTAPRIGRDLKPFDQPGPGEPQWSCLVNQNLVPVLVADVPGRIDRVNAAFTRLTGYAPRDIKGQSLRIFGHGPMAGTRLHDQWRLAGRGKPWRGEVQYRCKDGSWSWCEVNIVPVPDSKGTIRWCVGVFHDLRPLKEAQCANAALAERLHQAQRLESVGALAGGVAHDFNNILAIIGGFAHAGLCDAIPDSALREDLRNILTAVNRGKELTRRILTFSRKDHGSPRPLDLAATVYEGLKLVRAAIPSSIAIHEKLDDRPKIILGDETEWHQVITNLCVNSAQAIGQKAGEIEIELTCERHAKAGPDFGLNVPYLELAVHDTGPGIAPEDLPHIFDPFFTTKRCQEGTGLGLAIVHGIVAKSGGRMRAENRQRGGASIRILVPTFGEEAL